MGICLLPSPTPKAKFRSSANLHVSDVLHKLPDDNTAVRPVYILQNNLTLWLPMRVSLTDKAKAPVMCITGLCVRVTLAKRTQLATSHSPANQRLLALPQERPTCQFEKFTPEFLVPWQN